MSESRIRPQTEVQDAHDLIASILAGDAKGLAIPEDLKASLRNIQIVMCWVLQHSRGDAITDFLASVMKAITQAGYVLRDL